MDFGAEELITRVHGDSGPQEAIDMPFPSAGLEEDEERPPRDLALLQVSVGAIGIDVHCNIVAPVGEVSVGHGGKPGIRDGG